MKVLVNSYAVSPTMGSEPGVGWNWLVSLAQYCELFIITEGEWRNDIEEAMLHLPQRNNMHFSFIPVQENVRKMFKNQGDWRFYYYYRKWQIAALAEALRICSENQIDVIHQLNLTSFREPGYLWKIKGPKFVWGPLGGTNACPIDYIKGIDFKTTLKYRIKNCISRMQFRYNPRVKQAAKRADLIYCDSESGVRCFYKYFGIKSLQINETGCTLIEGKHIDKSNHKSRFDILWVGRFLPTKLLDLALRTISSIDRGLDIKLHILGTGSLVEKYQSLATALCIEDRCEWHGQVSREEVGQLMRQSSLFFFTSVVEGTPAVIMEAISNSLPILCFDTCGFGPLVDERIGIKIPLSTPEQSIKDFSSKIEYLYNNRDILQGMSNNCMEKIKTITWDCLAKRVVELYKSI